MIAIIKYNAGNIQSVKNRLDTLGCNSIITNNETEILNADKVILPGVGEASSAMAYLKKMGLDKILLNVKQPFLGICLGLQLMCESSEEGYVKGLGIFNTQVKRFPEQNKVPHIGWNNFTEVKGSLFEGINTEEDMYYVHSYYAEPNGQTMAVCDYILPFGAAYNQANFYATQFHPEKSSDCGQKLLKNFLKL